MGAQQHNDESLGPQEGSTDQYNGNQDASKGLASVTMDDVLVNGAEDGRTPDIDHVFQITVKLPHSPYEVPTMVSTQEQVQDLRQSIMESPNVFQYSCFHLEQNGQRINDFVELSEVEGIQAGSVLRLVEDPYSEKEARLHFVRIRELIGAASGKPEASLGIDTGLSLHDSVCPATPDMASGNGHTASTSSPGLQNPLADFDLQQKASLNLLTVPSKQPHPKTVKSLSVSAWNPPPPYLRLQGHLMYLQLCTNEGDSYQITAHVSGFYVNRSSNAKFDPQPKSSLQNNSAHSLFTLIGNLSSSFTSSFDALVELNNKQDPLANIPLTTAYRATPWAVAPKATTFSDHQPDLTRTQESFLTSGLDGNDTMRDWNEEIQSTKELPRATVQERVFRERLISKIHSEFTDAAVQGAILVARGEISPLNPTEARDAQIYVYNNIFYSFGADGVGTFTSEGGNEAARVAVGKDVLGVRLANQLDIPGLSTAGTIVTDYLGRRIVAQSIVPGIFRQREPDEHQVDYGGVEGRDTIADNPIFAEYFRKVSKALKIKSHPVWDKENKRHDLESSVETKGLLGTDGRKYILDLYRLTPLDIAWMESTQTESSMPDRSYPHKMTVLRPELIDSFWASKMKQYVQDQLAEQNRDETLNGSLEETIDASSNQAAIAPKDKMNDVHVEGGNGNPQASTTNDNRVDISKFTLEFNPDVFCGQRPQTEEEKLQWTRDEDDVRSICAYLHERVFHELLADLKDGEVGFPMDGLSLTKLLHRRGVNVRYLGKLAELASEDARGRAFKELVQEEMIARTFKHEVNRQLKELPEAFSTSCIAHLLNCLLGTGLNPKPEPQINDNLRALYRLAEFSFANFSPNDLFTAIREGVETRFRYELPEDWVQKIKSIPMLRSISMKLGLQVSSKDYQFATASTPTQSKSQSIHQEHEAPAMNGNVQRNPSAKKKKKAASNGTMPKQHDTSDSALATFYPEDIANIVPVVKDSCPKSGVAEEALEAGKISLAQNQKELGQELLLESLTLHEQIYGVLHPEVARVYHQLAMLYFQLDEKAAAVELAHKAAIVSERTLGIDSSETVLSYLNLALFEHGNRNTLAALACMRHALELWSIIYGPHHPDCMTTLNNAAVMLQQLQYYKQSRDWFERSLELCESISGRSSVNTATLLFQLAQALVLDGDHKGAVVRMREAYSIFLANLGPEDANTKESEKWLEQLTQNAVSMAKHAKDIQTQRIRRLLLNPKVHASGLASQPQDHQSAAQANGAQSSSRLDTRSIDELMKYIEGDVKRSSNPKKRNIRNNLRRKATPALDSAA